MTLSSKRAAFFNVGDFVVYGKWQNKPGKIIRFFDDGKGNPLIEVEPVPKGLKKNKIIPLFRIRHQRIVARVADRYLMAYPFVDQHVDATPFLEWLKTGKGDPWQDLGLLTQRVASRYLTAADDMQTLLLKLRKGVTTPIESIGKLKKVLDHLGGWNVEPFVGVVHVLYVGRGSGSLEEMAELYAVDKKHEVSSLPTTPRVDEVYVMDLREPAPWHKESTQYTLNCEVWIGAAGFKITSPEGKTYEALPNKGAWDKGNLNGDIRKLPKLGPKPLSKFMGSHGYVSWLTQETRFKQQVLDALGMDEHKKAAPRTEENTGSCPCCFRNIKLKWSGQSPTMVNHGFKRPGWGLQMGNCRGVGFPPFELSPRGTRHLVESLDKQRDHLKKNPERNSARMIEWLTQDMERLDKMIADWKEQPLPKAGVEVRDWQFKPR